MKQIGDIPIIEREKLENVRRRLEIVTQSYNESIRLIVDKIL
jgi:hypothetical protein